ncbi:adipokinetic hormone/corazonin-related peptide receptor variant I-like [Ornithodoros turicata]|uniref:adipokinetic hormone/corazonin-related peptide receptor variant I-like n=1 Tax=Ornithodoros turicata TaxID=34597 RepID=UPI00313910DF
MWMISVLMFEMPSSSSSTEMDIFNATSVNVFNASLYDDTLPEELSFNTNGLVQVVGYSVLFVVAAAGNVPVFVTLLRNRNRKSRIKLVIMHLTIADLIVTFIMIPLEIIWRLTVQWLAGNAMCKLMQVLRAFGPYLSSMVLVCISLDRYFAVVHPLKVNDAHRRGKLMIGVAWHISLICSVPQAIIFHVMEHPSHPGFHQCVTFSSFPTVWHEKAYNFFCLMALYGAPLTLIVYCYARILWEIYNQSRYTSQACSPEDATPTLQQYRGRFRLRRSDVRHMERARNKTLRLTVVIVLAFVFCWTPYVIMVLWYQFDPDSAGHVDTYLQSSLFMFAVSNSCVNPLVYGSYMTGFSNLWSKYCCRENVVPCNLSRQTSKQTLTSTVPRTPLIEKVLARDYAMYCSDSSPCHVDVLVNVNGTYAVLGQHKQETDNRAHRRSTTSLLSAQFKRKWHKSSMMNCSVVRSNYSM